MKSSILRCCLCCAAIGLVTSALAITPAEVQRKLQAGEKITFVDLRSRTAFQTGHIPNAINIPASLVPQKELPPLGLVVAYDAGLGTDTATAAAATLSAKPGITALPLEGGFAVWEDVQSVSSTRAAGLSAEEFPVITYDHLRMAQSNNVVLVDLRKPRAVAPTVTGAQAGAQPLTDLATEFPRAKITRSPFAGSTPTRTLAGSATASPLLVLIDNGDGAAQQMARTLKANGIKRFAILAGGEEMIARKGQPGLERVGSSTIVRQPHPSGATNSIR
jgi:rhodanese-related sulfurtransferase